MNLEEKLILTVVVLAAFITLTIVSSPLTGMQATGGGCGNDICEPTESCLTCPQDCCPAPPTQGCGNGICEPELGETFLTCPQDCSPPGPDCGDKVCGPTENCNSCPLDCGTCQGGTYQNQTTGDGNNITQPPPEDPTEFPPEIPMPEQGENITLPPEGASIGLEAGVTLGLFPLQNFNATIYNLTKVDPGMFKLLLCNQTSLASWEINVSADLAYLCIDYSKYEIEEPTLFIYKFLEGDWNPLPPSKITLDTEKKIICGEISSTPYLISGFSPTPNSRIALGAILDANQTIYKAKDQGIDVSIPMNVLNSAWSAYYICDFTLAKNLADRAKELLVSVPFSVVLIFATIIAAAWYNYYRVKMRVRLAKQIKVKKVVKVKTAEKILKIRKKK